MSVRREEGGGIIVQLCVALVASFVSLLFLSGFFMTRTDAMQGLLPILVRLDAVQQEHLVQYGKYARYLTVASSEDAAAFDHVRSGKLSLQASDERDSYKATIQFARFGSTYSCTIDVNNQSKRDVRTLLKERPRLRTISVDQSKDYSCNLDGKIVIPDDRMIARIERR